MKRKLILVLALFACQKGEIVPTIIRDGRQGAEIMDEHFIIIHYSEKDSYSDLE